jgi:hypothetical protein
MTAKTQSLIIDSAKLDAAIIATGQKGQAFYDAVQLVLASSVYQAVLHGNTNHLNAAIVAVGKGARKTAIAQWVLAHAPVVMETDKEKATQNPFRFSREKLGELMEGAANIKSITAEEADTYATHVLGQHWTEYKEPPLVPEKWSVSEALNKLLATAKSMQTKKVNIEGAAMLTALAALAAEAKASPEPAGL